jgi:RNA-binding protein YhbY
MQEIKKLQMGKNGITDNFIEQLRNMFTHTKIVKVTILKSACRNKADAIALADKLVEKLGTKFSYSLIGYVLTVRRFRTNQTRQCISKGHMSYLCLS